MNAGMRAALLSVLARRAEKLTAFSRPYRRVGWPIIEAAIFVRKAQNAGVRSIAGRTPVQLLFLAAAVNLGRGWQNLDRGARQRLRGVVAIGKALIAWDGGLRGEEIAAITRIPEERVFKLLTWAEKQGAFVNCGERGWNLR